MWEKKNPNQDIHASFNDSACKDASLESMSSKFTSYSNANLTPNLKKKKTEPNLAIGAKQKQNKTKKMRRSCRVFFPCVTAARTPRMSLIGLTSGGAQTAPWALFCTQGGPPSDPPGSAFYSTDPRV